MGRSILAVIVGYLTMAILVMGSLSIAFLMVGADRAYLPGSYDISTLWLIIWALTGLVAAIAGGCVCRKIARGAKPVFALAAVVFILGSLMA